MCLFFFQRSNIVHLQKCIYKNGSKKNTFTELPAESDPSVSNLHSESPTGNCVHKIYAKALALSKIKKWFPLRCYN